MSLPASPFDVPRAPVVVTERDRQIARVLLAGVAIGGAVVLLRVPFLRRLAWRGAKIALVSGLPALISRQMRAAWAASAAGPAEEPVPTPAAVPPPGPFTAS